MKNIQKKIGIGKVFRVIQNITTDIIEKYPDKPWSWEHITYNPNISPEYIENNLDKPWKWSYMDYNDNITLEFIENFR